MSSQSFEARYAQLRRLVDRQLEEFSGRGGARDLNEGLRYVLTSGGKRVRSTLVLLSCESVGGTTRDALPATAAVEMLHNFTLVHDDIMDNAPSRRGRPTVHVRWDVNNALLVGDVLLGMAYEALLRSRAPDMRAISSVFTDGFLDVCEGQALDLEFGRKRSVSLAQYFIMIEKKTARLISMSCELGAMLGNATPRQRTALKQFGHYLGRAFQVQDDLLDIVAEPERFGKAVGGDILEGKKTYLLTLATERIQGTDRAMLRRVNGATHGLKTPARRRAFVAEISDIYKQHGILDAAKRQIARDTAKATAALSVLPKNRSTAMLQWFSELLLNRAS